MFLDNEEDLKYKCPHSSGSLGWGSPPLDCVWTGLYTPPSAHPAEGSSTGSDPQDQTENTTTNIVTVI